jgi:hypothetical protein
VPIPPPRIQICLSLPTIASPPIEILQHTPRACLVIYAHLVAHDIGHLQVGCVVGFTEWCIFEDKEDMIECRGRGR